MFLTNERLKEILDNKPTLIFVGCSSNPSKPSHRVPAFMKEQGFSIIPINPTADEILGERVHRSLADIDEEIVKGSIVVLFRPSAEVPVHLEQCLKVAAPVLFLQEGIQHPSATEAANADKIDLVYDRCIMKEFKRLFF
ncbi:hypothetical protein P9112_004761 [Eukaryota sp. TZLM1-RC]